MAALSDPPARPGFGELTDLREIPAHLLDPLIEEEIAAWRRDLDWDFRPSADLVRRFVELQSLSGYALLQGSRVAGYSYYVCEEGKGLIGDLYVRAAQRTVENENALIEAVLDAMWRTPGVRRVESQLMMLSAPFGRPVPFPERFHSYPRCFLEASLAGVERFAPRDLPG